MIARTEEFIFHRINDLQWRIGIPPDGHSVTITNSEKYERQSKLLQNGYVIVHQEEGGDYVVLGREVEVELEAFDLADL